MTSYKHLAFIKFLSLDRHHWCDREVGVYNGLSKEIVH